jgi:type I restriction enzyme M protein
MDIDIIKNIISSPIKVVDTFDYDNNIIAYSDRLVQHRKISKIKGEEEICRAVIMTQLVNSYGYKIEKLEIEEEYKAGRPLTMKPRVDLTVMDPKGDIFLFIELKSPKDFETKQDLIIEDQLFNLAAVASAEKNCHINYLALATCNLEVEGCPIEAIVIDYQHYKSFSAWKNDRNFANEIPANYGLAMKEPYIKGGEKDLDKNYTKSQIDGIRDNLHNVLWGGGSVGDNEIFNSLVNLILAKIQDEGEKKEGEEYDFQIKGYKESTLKFETNQELFSRINGLYRRALNRRMHIIDNTILEKSYVIDEEKFPLNKLKYAVSVLEKYSFVDGKNSLNGKDILGDFFEGIIRNGFKQSKGQFFTHTNIVRFILWGLQIDKLALEHINKELVIPYVIDPSAGSATFLIEYMKFVTENIKRRFKERLSNNRDVEDKFEEWFKPDHRENRWAKDFIYGVESNKDLAKASKVNMILHGDGSTNIFALDGLLPFTDYKKYNNELNALNHEENDPYYPKPVNCQFDVVISNPPFSVDLDKETQDTLSGSFIFSLKSNSENLFIERYYQLLRENGRMGIVLPESIFDTSDNKYIRLFIYKYFKVKAVVSIPSLAFAPYTQTKTSLLFAQKKTANEILQWNKLWDKYSSEYYSLSVKCKNILEVYLKGKSQKKYPSIANLDEEELKKNIIRLVSIQLKREEIKTLKLTEIIELYKNDISMLCTIDKDTSDVFGKVNVWWVFNQVAEELNYKIFMADVEEIGFKRTLRGVKERKNELFRSIKDKIIVDDGNETTVLDYLRKISWD